MLDLRALVDQVAASNATMDAAAALIGSAPPQAQIDQVVAALKQHTDALAALLPPPPGPGPAPPQAKGQPPFRR